jgi:hypothetical protein
MADNALREAFKAASEGNTDKLAANLNRLGIGIWIVMGSMQVVNYGCYLSKSAAREEAFRLKGITGRDYAWSGPYNINAPANDQAQVGIWFTSDDE